MGSNSKQNKRAINVLEIINLFPSAESFIGDQFSYLKGNGYELHLICSDHPRLLQFAENHEISFKPIKLNRGITPFADLIALYKVYNYIKRNKIDIVIAHQAKARLIGTLASWICKVPRRIIFAHGVLYETMRGLKRKVFINIDRFVSALSTEIVCVSNSVKDVRKKDKIDKHTKPLYLLNKGTCGGIDTKRKFNPTLYSEKDVINQQTRLGIKDNDFVLGFCGRLVNDKGINELLSAFKILLNKYPSKNIKLLIIGNPEIRDSISPDSIDFLKTNKNVIFTGYIEYNAIPLMYLLMDVLILPSYREGFPTVVLEAGAMNIPCIVSKSTGCIDSIKEDVTGIYCDIEPFDICSKIELFFDAKFRDKFNGSREYVVKNYDHSVVWPEILKIIKNGSGIK